MSGADHSDEAGILAILHRAGVITPDARNRLYLQIAAHYERVLLDKGLHRTDEGFYERMRALDVAIDRVEAWLQDQSGEGAPRPPVEAEVAPAAARWAAWR